MFKYLIGFLCYIVNKIQIIVFWFYLHFRQLKCGNHTVKQICNNDEDDAYLFVCWFVFLVRYYTTTIKVQQLVLCTHKERSTSQLGPVCDTLACSPCSDTLLEWKEDMLESQWETVWESDFVKCLQSFQHWEVHITAEPMPSTGFCYNCRPWGQISIDSKFVLRF